MKGIDLDILIARIRKRKTRKRIKLKYNSPLTPEMVLKAIPDTFGNISVIAARLHRPYSTVCGWMKKAPDYVKEAMREEQERLVDIAEQTNLEMMTQRIHFPTAVRASHFILTRHPEADKRGYKDKTELTVQGGKNPIQLQNKHIVSVAQLKNIPLKDRKRLLEEMGDDEGDDE